MKSLTTVALLIMLGACPAMAVTDDGEGSSGFDPDAVGAPSSLLMGDANGDFIVDVSDLGILAGSWGAPEGKSWGTGDFNGDGAVDVEDLGLLAGNWNVKVMDEPAEPAAAPEPMTIVASVLGVGGLAGYLRRRNTRSA